LRPQDEEAIFYTFPSLETLASVPERALREMGFGYRAKYIPKAAQQVLAKDEGEKPRISSSQQILSNCTGYPL